LLVEMDGFDVRSGVIVIAATNRVDILDPALLRPGRFDRHIMVSAPDVKGRAAILATHSRDKHFDDDVSYDILARRTPGMTGADLANVINEAALRAAKRTSQSISMHDVEAAIDRVMAGPERLTRVLSQDQRRVVAYHEAGHAICGHVLPEADDVHKVSIVPRGAGLGWTMSLPEDDRILVTRTYLRSVLVMTLGGRSAEEVVFAEITTGAADDIDKATQLARRMVTHFGMSDRIGLIKLGDDDQEVFMGRSLGHAREYSDDTAMTVDAEVRRLIEAAHAEARAILTEHRETLDQLATELLEVEKLGPEDLKRILGPLPTWNFAD
jgi:cell division protease FtsH